MITTAAVASATSNIEQENNNNKQSSSNDAFVKIIILFLKKILKFKSLGNKDIEKYTKISKILNDLSGNITKKFKKEAFKAMEKLIKNSTFLVEVKEFIKELIENFEILNINNQIVNLVDDDDDDLIEDENFENFKMKLSEIMSTLTNQSNTIVEVILLFSNIIKYFSNPFIPLLIRKHLVNKKSNHSILPSHLH